MKNIHVIFIYFTHGTLLDQAIASLQYIKDRVESVTVLGGKKDSFIKSVSSSLWQEIKFIRVTDENLGGKLDSLIRTISSEYILILYNGNCLNANIKKVKLELDCNQTTLAYDYTNKDKTIQFPFLIRTSFIKKTDFLSRYTFPFCEALMPAWLASVEKAGMVSQKGDFITHQSNQGSVNTLRKMDYIEKYQNVSQIEGKPPSIGVILANYNMAQYVGVAISSCLLQTSPAEQILVIDDGSTDHSYKELEKWRTYPGVRIFLKANGGKARALNQLLSYIATDYVLEMDADDWLDPDAFMIIRQQLMHLPEDVAVLYGNLRTWKQRIQGNLLFKGVHKGHPVRNKRELLAYEFPLGPRIYRSSALKTNGFPVIDFEDGRMYEDISVLNDLIKKGRLLYKDFTVYNVREHPLSITKRNRSDWNDFLNYLD